MTRPAPALTGCFLVAVASTAGAATTHTVDVLDFDFSPADITVDACDTVEWTWGGVVLHSVTAAAGQIESFDSGLQTTGTFDYTFNAPGTVNYYCTLHGNDLGGGAVSGMSGSVEVLDPMEPELTITGTCPGPMQIEICGLKPGGEYALVTGNDNTPGAVPGGSCVGTVLDISDGLKVRKTGATGSGFVGFAPNLPVAACGLWVQVVRINNCTVSNAVQIL